MVGLRQQPAARVTDFDVKRILLNRHRAERAGVTPARWNFFIFPGIISRHRPGEHEFRLRRMHLRPAGHPNAEGARRNEINGERQLGIGGVLVVGKLVRLGGRDDGQVVVEGVAHGILRALVNNFSRMGRRIKRRNLVGEIIKIFQRAKIAADVHGLVEQGERRRGGDGGRGGKTAKAGGGNFVQCNHVGIICWGGISIVEFRRCSQSRHVVKINEPGRGRVPPCRDART